MQPKVSCAYERDSPTPPHPTPGRMSVRCRGEPDDDRGRGGEVKQSGSKVDLLTNSPAWGFRTGPSRTSRRGPSSDDRPRPGNERRPVREELSGPVDDVHVAESRVALGGAARVREPAFGGGAAGLAG